MIHIQLALLILLGGGYKIYSVLLGGQEIARAETMPKIYKFPFMKMDGMHIGPCFTLPEYRGKNLYPHLLTYIMNDNPSVSVFYIICSDTNEASKRGIRKAGFHKIGTGKKTLFRRYKIERYTE